MVADPATTVIVITARSKDRTYFCAETLFPNGRTDKKTGMTYEEVASYVRQMAQVALAESQPGKTLPWKFVHYHIGG